MAGASSTEGAPRQKDLRKSASIWMYLQSVHIRLMMSCASAIQETTVPGGIQFHRCLITGL